MIDLAGTPAIKSKHGWRPVGVSSRESAGTITQPALTVPSVELFTADNCFFSPLHGAGLLLVACHEAPLLCSQHPNEVSDEKWPRWRLCFLDFNEWWLLFTEDVGVLISSLPLSPYEKEKNQDTYPRDTAIKVFTILPLHYNLRHANYPTHSLDEMNWWWDCFFKIRGEREVVLRPQCVGRGTKHAMWLRLQ